MSEQRINASYVTCLPTAQFARTIMQTDDERFWCNKTVLYTPEINQTQNKMPVVKEWLMDINMINYKTMTPQCHLAVKSRISLLQEYERREEDRFQMKKMRKSTLDYPFVALL